MSDLMLDVGTANDLKMAFRRAGFDPADITKLCTGDMAAKILPILRGTGIVQIVKHVINLAGVCMPDAWKRDKWKIEKHVGTGMLELDPSRLRLHLSPNQKDGKVINGHKLREELESGKVPVLNACVLDHLLAHQEIIPEDWKVDENGNTRYIYFWNTIYRGPRGGLCVRHFVTLNFVLLLRCNLCCLFTYGGKINICYGVFLFCDKLVLEVGESVNAENRWPPKLVSVHAEYLRLWLQIALCTQNLHKKNEDTWYETLGY